MKSLKVILASIYAVLIILLLLMYRCNGRVPQHIPITDSVATPIAIPIQEVPIDVGGSGELKITLMWDFYADIDIHVIEPSGNHIYYANQRNLGTSGNLDVDNRIGGNGAAENVYWENCPKGVYDIDVHYYGSGSSNLGTGDAGIVTVYIMYKGLAYEYKVELRSIGDRVDVANFNAR